MRICKECNKEYNNVYGGKYKYTIKTTFCSKRCALQNRVGVLTTDSLRSEIVAYLTLEGRYCTQREVLTGIKRSSKTLTKYKISLLDIQRDLGLVKPVSVFQSRVSEILIDIYGDLKQEVTFKGLLSPKGFPLFVDFYSESTRTIIEADGNQHWDTKNSWYSDYNLSCDLAKNKYATDNGYRLVRIPYTKNVTIKYISKYLRA